MSIQFGLCIEKKNGNHLLSVWSPINASIWVQRCSKTKISSRRPIPNSHLLCVFIQTGRLNRQHQGPSKPFAHCASVFPKFSQSQCVHPLQRHLKAPGTKKSAWLWKEKIPYPSMTSNWKSNDTWVCRYCRVAVQSQHIRIVFLLFTAVVL